MPGNDRVLCFGEALWDVLPGERRPGGAPMNVALRLRHEGVDAQLLTRVGLDENGAELLAFLEAQGLDTTHVQRDSVQPTGIVDVDLSDPNEARYQILDPAAWDFIDAEAYLQAGGGEPETLVFGSLAARRTDSLSALRCLIERASLRVFDVNLRPPFSRRETLEELLQAADWVKVNEIELALIAGWHGAADGVKDSARCLQQVYGLDAVCVTLGGEGAFLLHGEEAFSQPPFTVEVLDTVGCGDAFLGAWLAAMLRGADPPAALERAAAMGALVASREGANPVITEASLLELLNT
jgi:fructokinase